MTQLRLLSASQIDTFVDCPRKWAWRYLVGLFADPHPSALLGTEVDDTQLQPYLRDGRAFDYTRDSGYIAASALEYLPPPKSPGLEVQKHFVMPSPTWRDGAHVGFGYQGYLDVWDPKATLPGVEGNAPVVADFKTTSDLKWAKSPAVLATDTQAQLYATWALYTTRATAVDLVWIYMQTRGARKARRVHLRVTADHVAAQFRRIDELAIGLLEVREELETWREPEEAVRALQPNATACEKYGGCPYRDKCNLSPAEMLGASFGIGEEIMSTAALLSRLKSKKTDAPAPAPAPVVNEPPPAAELPAWATAPVDPRAAGAVTPVSNPLAPHIVGKRPDGTNVYASDINPPESALPPAPPVGAAAPTPAPAPAESAPKRGPGRPAGSPNKPKEEAPAPAPIAFPDRITARWGEERYQPLPYQHFTVGPFEYTTDVRPGETAEQAYERAHAELAKMSSKARDAQAAAFVAAVGGGE